MTGRRCVDHSAIHRRRVFRRIHPQAAGARAGDGRPGLELSQFVISKDRATPTTVPAIGPFYDYTVFAGDEIFTVTQPDDIRFPEYFYRRCIAEDATPPAPRGRRRLGLISRLFSWMTPPI
jgi:hypothetical protein